MSLRDNVEDRYAVTEEEGVSSVVENDQSDAVVVEKDEKSKGTGTSDGNREEEGVTVVGRSVPEDSSE